MENKQTVKKILMLIKPQMHFLILSLVFAVITVVTTLYAPVLTGRAIDYIIGPSNVEFSAVAKILVRFAAVFLVTSVSQWLMNICNNKITYNVVYDMRIRAFERLEQLPLKYIDQKQYGDLISRIINDVDQFSDGLLMGFSQLFTGVVTIVGTLGFMISINIKITAVVVIITPLSLFVASFIAKHTYDMFKKQSETRGKMTALVEEMVGNQKIVKAFGYESRAEERFEDVNQELRKYGMRAIFYSSLTNPCTRFVNNLVYIGVGIFGAFSAINGNLTIGQLSCFLTYANQYTKPFNEISGVVTELQNAIASAARVFEIIEEEPQTPDAPNARVLDNADGTLSLENVCFSYSPDRKLIENFNLSVKSGQRIAIVGPTGCGKTTIINLLMRFYDVDKGEIVVSGTPVKDITRDSLRGSWGMVLQDTWLKSGTIRDNIAYANLDAAEDEVIRAAQAAHAHGFIRRLPDGYDTVIGEDGGSISQGQKQLLCIARVMLSLPPMLILDEATSSIDTRTEIRIQSAFAEMMRGRTSFIVAHRLSTIKEADVILVMRDGSVVEQGTHNELLAKNGFYAELYNSQFKQ